jgi:LacI family transcriptional regulator
MVELCKLKGIPVVFIDSNIETEDVLGYFGQDAFSSGYLAARLMKYGICENSTILILKLAKNKATFSHLMKREEGFISFFKENPSLKIKTISIEIDLSLAGEPSKSLVKLIHETSYLNAIFVTNSRVHKIANVLMEERLSHLLLIGYDLVDENIKYLKDGVIDFLICQKPEEQGYRSIMAMFNHILSKKSIERVNYSPIDIIMRENIAFYKNLKT